MIPVLVHWLLEQAWRMPGKEGRTRQEVAGRQQGRGSFNSGEIFKSHPEPGPIDF